MTLVHTFTQQHYHHDHHHHHRHHNHHHHLLCACCLSHSICLNPPNSSIIHLLHPPCFTSSCPESVSSAGHQMSHPVSQNQGLHSNQYVKAPWSSIVWNVYFMYVIIIATSLVMQISPFCLSAMFMFLTSAKIAARLKVPLCHPHCAFWYARMSLLHRVGQAQFDPSCHLWAHPNICRSLSLRCI